MKKTRVLSLLLILAMALSLTLSAAAYADGEKNDWKGIVWERDSLLDALFIRGVGVLPVEQPMPWQSDAARNVAVCFDDGVTEIPAGFTAGCVNMKTVMIPASVRSIGQGVLAISGGLKDVYYQGTLQGLLSIQMFPEDRAALNGAVFHQSKINYDREDQPFDYVPIEHAEEGKMSIVDDGETVTGTLSDGTTYTLHYRADGQIDSYEYSNKEYNYDTKRHYRPDGTLEWEITTRVDKATGKTVTAKNYYDASGENLVKSEFTRDTGEKLTEEYANGKLVKDTAINREKDKVETFYDDNEKKTKSISTYANGTTVTTDFDENEHPTKSVSRNPDNSVTTTLYENGIKKQTTTEQSDGIKVITQYYDDGERQKQRTRISPDGTTLITDYAEDGVTPTKKTEVAGDNSKIQQLTYENGNLTASITSYAPGVKKQNGKDVLYEQSEIVNGEAVDLFTEYADGSWDYAYHYGNDTVIMEGDANNNIVKVTTKHPDDSYYVEAYDASNNLVHTEYSPEGKKTYEAVKDNMGNKVNEKFFNEDGSWTQIDYDGGSTITRYFDKNGQETTETGSPIVP